MTSRNHGSSVVERFRIHRLIARKRADSGNGIPISASKYDRRGQTLGEKRHMRSLAVILAVALAGCAVGPDFRRPAPPPVASYTPGALPAETATAPGVGGAAQHFVSGGDIPARWWELFRSEALDRWIREALSNSPTLGAAEATLRRAQEIRRARSGVLLPSVDGSVSATRQKPSGAFLGEPNAKINPFTLYDASVDVSYTLDLFGRTHRELEALQAQVDYQAFQVEGACLTLTSNIVTAALQEASLRAQLQATRDILATQEEQLAMIEIQFRLGGNTQTDVLAQRAFLAQSRATLPPLEKRLAQTRHLLAVLAGRFPGEAADLPEFHLEAFRLPEELPVSLPSSLVRQRPDIRSAEELLHAANATVGVARRISTPRSRCPPGSARRRLDSATCSTQAPPSGMPERDSCSPSSAAGRWKRPVGPRSPASTRPRPNIGRRCCTRSATWPTCFGRWNTTP
jgi:NodT family efflux transporter outer membrane factor (OMF) lipoprotein